MAEIGGQLAEIGGEMAEISGMAILRISKCQFCMRETSRNILLRLLRRLWGITNLRC